MRRLPLGWCLALICAVSGCSSSPAGPSAQSPTIYSVDPSSGPTSGGSAVTLLGSGFSAGDTLTFGGTPATKVSVSGTTMLTATTPPHAAGAVNVSVASGNGTATLRAAFTYVLPPPTINVPPTITALAAKGSRTNEPAQFADIGEAIGVVATVTDPETPVANLTYAWASTVGSFTGIGPSVTWTAPVSVSAPTTATLTLTVTETYATVDPSGLPVTATNTVTKSVTVSVHDTAAEVGGMATQFLDDFSHSNITDVSYILRNFTDTCKGKRDEANDVQNNRDNYLITAYTLGPPSVRIGFGAGCPVHNVPGDACADVPSSWTATDLSTGTSGTVSGFDQVSAVYLTSENRWALCGSDFMGNSSTSSIFGGFIR